jgi:hypothetical protein
MRLYFSLPGLKSLKVLAAVFTGLVLIPSAMDAVGRGSPPPLPRVFKKLIAQGERPEIVVCMVAAADQVRSDPQLDAIRWGEDVSSTAHLEDSEENGRMLRKIRLEGKVHDRHITTSDPWHPVRVLCEQKEGEVIRVQFVAQ